MYLMLQNDLKVTLAEKIKSAITRFQTKFHVQPTHCLISPELALAEEDRVEVIVIKSKRCYSPLIIQIGTERE